MALGPTGRTPTPDRRYLRRANRGVRKARRLRTLGRWSVILAFNGAVLAMLVFSGTHAMRRLTTSSELSLQAITMEGVHRGSRESIRARLADMAEVNLLELDLDLLAERIREEPWVADCAVRRVLPDGLHVRVNEREPVALTRVDESLQVVDKTGRIVGPASADLQGRLPILTGSEHVPEEERAAVLRRGVTALAALHGSASKWTQTVREIDLSRVDRIAVMTKESEPRLLLDPERVDRNLAHYLALRDEIEDRVGSVEYVDLRWSDRIAVMPVIRKPAFHYGDR